MNHSPQAVRVAVLLLLCLGVVGCSGYELRGRVIGGQTSWVGVVDAEDPRLSEPHLGMGGAAIEATLDPQNLNYQRLGKVVSQGDGAFALPVEAKGAGWLEYDIQMIVELAGYAPAVGEFRLPGQSKRVLVVLGSGEGEAAPRRGSDLLEETLRMSEPYLDER